MENEVKVETKKKGNVLFTLFACIMTGVIVFLATNIGQKASKTVDPDTPKKNEVTSNVESNTASNVTDTTLTEIEKSYINDKMSLLFSGATIKNNLIKVVSLENPWTDIFKGLNDKSKALIILNDYHSIGSYPVLYGDSVGTFVDKETKTAVLEQEDDALVVDTADFTEKYKKVFGVAPSYVDAGSCPAYHYDSTNKVYVSISACGGAGGSGQMVYIDSYSKTSDSIIVTTYVGGTQFSPEQTITYNDYYAGYDKMPKSSILNTDSKDYKELTITSDNKTKFTKYNFVFKKAADGQYYFSSVAKAN